MNTLRAERLGLTACDICGLTAPTNTHPCRFEKGCKCWRGASCQGDGPATVKRVALDGAIEDTYATEAEHNGYRATQARLLDADKKPPAVPADQGVLM